MSKTIVEGDCRIFYGTNAKKPQKMLDLGQKPFFAIFCFLRKKWPEIFCIMQKMKNAKNVQL